MLQIVAGFLLVFAASLSAETEEHHFRVDYIREQCKARGDTERDGAACVEREIAAGREIGKWLRANDDATKKATLVRCGSADQRPDGLQGVLGCIRGKAKTLRELSLTATPARSVVPRQNARAPTPKPARKSSKTPWNADAPQASDVRSETKAMSFEQCMAVRDATIAMVGGSARVIPIVNTKILNITRICATDGSVLVSCSSLENKMVLTRSPHGADVGCP